MNELIICGMMCGIILLLGVVTSIVERWDALYDWLFDLCTAYYKFKAQRARKRGRRCANRKRDRGVRR